MTREKPRSVLRPSGKSSDQEQVHMLVGVPRGQTEALLGTAAPVLAALWSKCIDAGQGRHDGLMQMVNLSAPWAGMAHHQHNSLPYVCIGAPSAQ